MAASTNATWRNYLPTLVLLGVIGAFALFYFSGSTATPFSEPKISTPVAGLLVLIGLVAGFLGGIIGTGGCSVMLPSIHFWLGYPAALSVGTTLFAVIFTAISGGYGHLVRKNLDVRATCLLGGSGLLGVVFGSWLFTKLAGHASLLGLILGLAFLWPALRMTREGVGKASPPQKEGNIIPGPATGLVAFGFIIGILTGVVGLGGGYALVPGLLYLFGAPVYLTMGTSLATMIPLALMGGGIKLFQGYVALGAGLLLAAGTVVGAQVGAAVIKKFRANTLKLIFGVYFLYVSLKFIFAYFGVMIW